MSMVCPRCNTSFEERYHCPSCGIPLVASGSFGEGGSGIYGRPKWQQTTWGRILVGVLLAQGLYYGLWQLSTAAILGLVEELARANWWNTSAGWFVLQVMLVIGVTGGGMMAGAGQKGAAVYGAILGAINSLIFLAVPKGTSRPLTAVEFYSQPLLQIAFGMLGAWIGGRIWRPLVPIVSSPSSLATTPPAVGRLELRPNSRRPSFFAGPVNWMRVMAGTIVAIVGSSWANLILKWILDSGAGLTVESQYHARFVTWEISVLALLVGAGVAGSNSRNGAKQGLLVGLAVCAGLLGIYYQSGQKTPPGPSLIFDLLRIRFEMDPAVQTIIWTGIVIAPLALFGGWFASQLLPPLSPSRRKDRVPTWV